MRSLACMQLIYLALASFLVCSCATRQHVAHEYDSVLAKYPSKNDRTVVVILVDGLSRSMLEAAHNNMTNINSYFEFSSTAHTTFPSLTFPAIASLLKEKPINETGLIGNSFYKRGKLLKFENPLERKKFSELMTGDNIFTRLRNERKRSVSLDYGLGVDATSITPLEDFESMLTIAENDYDYADQKKIDSLYNLLSSYSPEDWPSFVFLHLIGVDFLAHTNGPLDPATISYVADLDDKLKPLLELLRQEETRHTIATVFTADHGFAENIRFSLNLESIMAKQSEKIEVLNEGRMAAVFLHGNSKSQAADSLMKYKGIEAVAFKSKDKIILQTNSPESKFPFFRENLVNYFAAANSPDLVVIPDDETVFSKTYVGYHGGPTAAETLVPLLTRNSKLSAGQSPALWNLLKELVK